MGTFFLSLASTLAARPSLWRAAVRLVTVSNRRFNVGIQSFMLELLFIRIVFNVTKMPFALYATLKVSLSSFFNLLLIRVFVFIFCFDVVEQFSKIRILRLFLEKNKYYELHMF